MAREKDARDKEQEARDKEAEARAVLGFVQDKILAAARPEGQEGGLGSVVTLRQALEAALPQVESSFEGRPLVEAAVRKTLGLSFLYLGDAGTAEQQFRIARARYTAGLGLDRPDTLWSMNGLALSYAALGRHAEALRLHEETLALKKAKLGADHPETLSSMSNLALSFLALGRHGEALRLHEETLALWKAKLGPDHPLTLRSMNNLANNYDALGRHGEALKLREETLTLRKVKLRPAHPETLGSMGNLADSYDALGRHGEALKLHEETLALIKAKLGPDHPDTLRIMNNLALSYDALGRHGEALKLHEETLALKKAKLGPDHPETLVSMANLAESLIRDDRWSEAMAILDDCLRRVEGKAVDPRLVGLVLERRLRFFAKQGDASGCRQTAAMWERLDRKDADSLYGAACFRAITAAVFRSKSSQADGARQAGIEADRAMAWLWKAVAAGYDTPQYLAHMTRDPDLDALRDRDVFRRLLAGLMDRGFPADPFAD
jgi:tetratricopeptide (TPR) repeat protein